MSKADLEKALETLQSEIEQLGSENQQVKDRLTYLISDVEQTMQQPDTQANDSGFEETIQQMVEHFEADHPRITDTLNRIMVSLASMGI